MYSAIVQVVKSYLINDKKFIDNLNKGCYNITITLVEPVEPEEPNLTKEGEGYVITSYSRTYTYCMADYLYDSFLKCQVSMPVV